MWSSYKHLKIYSSTKVENSERKKKQLSHFKCDFNICIVPILNPNGIYDGEEEVEEEKK